MEQTLIAISAAAVLVAGVAYLARAAASASRVPSVDARFMGILEKRRLFSGKNGGFVVDGKRSRLSEADSFRNVAVVAPTGAGKTAVLICTQI